MNQIGIRRFRSVADLVLIIGLIAEAIIVGVLGVLNALWVNTFARFAGMGAVGITMAWSIVSAVILAVIVWGLVGALKAHSHGGETWKRAGVISVCVVNVIAFVMLAVDFFLGPKFERLDYLQNAIGMSLAAAIAASAFSVIRKSGSDTDLIEDLANR